MSDNIYNVSEWTKFADGDLNFASWGLESENPSAHSICFLCQSAAEKYIKALLIKNGWQLKKQHDLIFLANQLKIIYKYNVSNILDDLVILNEYIEEARYPGDIDISKFTVKMAQQAVSAVKNIQKFAKKHLA